MDASMSRPVKVILSDDTALAIGRLVAEVQAKRRNYQIGIGTLTAEMVENLVAKHPDLIQKLLDEPDVLESVKEINRRPQKKENWVKRKAA